MQIIAMLGSNISLKDVILLTFILVVIGAAMWFVSTKPIPQLIQWLVYFVLGAVAIILVWRFLSSL